MNKFEFEVFRIVGCLGIAASELLAIVKCQIYTESQINR